jgi:hypothetical protein
MPPRKFLKKFLATDEGTPGCPDSEDTQRDSLAPDISVYAPDNVPDADAKTDFSKMVLFVEF